MRAIPCSGRLGVPGLLVAMGLCLWSPGPAFGKPQRPRAAPAQVSTAEALVRSAEAALQGGSRAEALRLIERSLRLAPSPEALFQLGALALSESRTVEAHDLMRRYLADPDFAEEGEAPSGQAVSPHLAEARRVVASPPPPSGQLVLLGERGTIVRVDGRIVGALPLSRPLMLSPSEHTVTLENGTRKREEQVQIPAGRLAELRGNAETGATLLNMLPGVVVLDELAGLPAAAAPAIALAVERALVGEHLSPLPRALALELAKDASLARCLDTAACQGRLAQKCDADATLTVRAIVPKPLPPGATWQLTLTVVDPSIEQVAAQVELPCPACTPDKAAQLVGEAFGPLWNEALRRPRGKLSIEADPPDASFTLDERPVPAALLAKPLPVWAGPHELRVRRPGYQEERQSIEVPPGGVQTLHLVLRAEPEPSPPALAVPPVAAAAGLRRPARPRWRVVTGAVLAGGGLLMLGIGGRAIAISGTCATYADASSSLCTEQYSTHDLGTGLTLGGMAAIVGGTLLIAIPERRRP